MREELIGNNEPVSTAEPVFLHVVSSVLRDSPPLFGLIRYANAAGSKDYFILRSQDDFDAMLGRCRAKDSISIFFAPSLPIRGVTDDSTLDQTLELFEQVAESPDSDDLTEIDVVRLDSPEAELDASHLDFFCSAEEIREWFAKHPNVPVAIGQLDFCKENGDEVVSAYVPDADGIVRPGAY